MICFEEVDNNDQRYDYNQIRRSINSPNYTENYIKSDRSRIIFYSYSLFIQNVKFRFILKIRKCKAEKNEIILNNKMKGFN